MDKIVIDVGFLNDQYSFRGIGHYGNEIISRLIQDKEFINSNKIYFLHYSSKDELETRLNTKIPKQIELVKISNRFISNPVNNFVNYFIKKKIIRNISPDLVWDIEFGRIITNPKITISTIFDLIPYHNNSYSAKGMIINFLKGKYYIFTLKKALVSKKIITISKHVADDIVETFSIDEDKIIVIPLAARDIYFRKDFVEHIKLTLDKFKLKNKDYLIYDSGIEGNKNFELLLNTFAELKNYWPYIKLVLTGKYFSKENGLLKPESSEAKKYIDIIQALEIEKEIIPVGRISELELTHLLSSAKLYINLSKNEGYGLGPIQAMASFSPAVVLDTPIFNESTGGYAIIVSGTAKEIAKETVNRIKKHNLEEQYKWVKKYNWDNTYTETINIIRNNER